MGFMQGEGRTRNTASPCLSACKFRNDPRASSPQNPTKSETHISPRSMTWPRKIRDLIPS